MSGSAKPLLLAIFAGFAFNISLASPLPQQNMKLLGQATLRWLFFDLYHAQLYSADGRYQQGQYPLVLSLQYQRDIAKDHLITATEKEWQRLDSPYQASWLASLQSLWPDIRQGDTLSFIAHSADRGEYFFNGQALGSVEASGFAESFLSIWLSPQSRDQKLRSKLLAQ